MTRVKRFSREHRGLLALNGVLLLALLVVTFAPSADAQRENRRRGAYAMVSARALGFTEAAIWIVDGANQEMIAMRYDRSNKQLRFLGFRDLEADARAAGRGGR
jgi:hypothetical protein